MGGIKDEGVIPKGGIVSNSVICWPESGIEAASVCSTETAVFPQREALRHPKQAAGSGTDDQYFQLGLGVVFYSTH